jgi:5'-methylthioadenosine phosphorylase
VIHANVALARRVITELAPRVAALPQPGPYHEALRHAVMTAPDKIPSAARERLALFLDRYLG